MKYKLQLLLVLLFFLGGLSSLQANNGLVIGFHANSNNWKQSELGIPSNRNRELSNNTGSPFYGTAGAGMEATPGGNVMYSAGWNGGSGTKAWTVPMTTSGFTNLALSFYQRSRAQDVGVWEYGPRDFKLQYSTNGTVWNDVPGGGIVLTSNWQKFNISLPAACNNQPNLYLKWLMTSNVSIAGGSIAAGALSDFADMMMYGDEIPQPMTDMALSNMTISLSAGSGATVGTLSVTDPNFYDTFTYSLAAGEGDAGNGNFLIDGTSLKTKAELAPGNYAIRIQVSDGTYTRTENYTIRVSAYPIVTVGDPNWNSDAWITRVQFADIDSPTGMSGENNSLAYSDYTGSVATVTQGQTVDLTVSVNVVNSYTENVRVYIDWNRNYSLLDDGECVNLVTGSSATGAYSNTVSITVPSGSVTGNTLMRVVVDNGAGLALGGSDYGEVEDYTIKIQPAISFTDGSLFAQSFTPNAPDQILGRFKLTGSSNGAAFTSAAIKLNNTRSGLSNFKLWSSSDELFGSDSQLGSTVASDPGDGATVTFSGFNSPITQAGVYYFLTADAASGVTGTVQCIIRNAGDLAISNGTLGGTISSALLSGGTSPLPVELTLFTASLKDNKIQLSWQTETEVDNYGFEVERRLKPSEGGELTEWKKIGFLQGSGNSNSRKDYSFIDASPAGGILQYRLKQIDNDGTFEYHPYTAEVKGVELPEEFSLEQNYPNPFNPSTTIKFALPRNSNVTIEVYTLLGEKIMTLVNEIKSAGYHEAVFSGSSLSSGIYIYAIRAVPVDGGSSFISSQKMMLVK